MKRITLALTAAAALLVPAVAQAHVSLHPNEVPTGSFATLDIRVPNEMESANTVKLAVQVPPGFLDISTEYMPGWTSKVLTSKLAKPVQTEDGEVTEQVKEIIWTGERQAGQDPARPVSQLPDLDRDPRQGGRRADLQDAAVLRQRRSRALDRPAQLRRTGAADRRHRRRRGAAGRRRLGDGAAEPLRSAGGSQRTELANRARATAPARASASPL